MPLTAVVPTAIGSLGSVFPLDDGGLALVATNEILLTDTSLALVRRIPLRIDAGPVIALDRAGRFARFRDTIVDLRTGAEVGDVARHG